MFFHVEFLGFKVSRADIQLSTSAPHGTGKVIPRVRQRLRLLVLADTADKRVAEVWDPVTRGTWPR